MKIRTIALVILSVLIMIGCDTRTPSTPDKVVNEYNLNLSTDRDVIYADNGQSVAQVTAYLTDADGVPKSGSSVVFYPSQGKMVGTVTTDQTGRATSNFDDDGQSADAVLVVAQYTDSETNVVRDSIYIQVLPMEALVDTFFIDTQPVDGIVEVSAIDSSYEIEIFSHVFDQNGVPVENVRVNYQITSDADGVGYIDVAMDSTNAIGVSSTTFHTNLGRLGVVTVQASISSESIGALMRDNPGVYAFNKLRKSANGSAVFSAEVTLQVVASNPYDLSVLTQDNLIYADLGETTARVYGVVRDISGNPISGVTVHFSSNIGTISSPGITDASGIAETIFSDLGTEFDSDSTAMILARVIDPFHGDKVDSTQVEVRLPDDQANTNFFVITDPPSGQILITEIDSIYIAAIRAQVRDSHGVALEGVTVDFQVTAGSSLGYLSEGNSVSDSSGTATASFFLNPGMSGTVSIEAFLAGDDAVDPISSDIEFIPMSDYEITAFSYQSIIYYDNGLTTAQVYAVVRDLDGNSIDSIQVNFSSDLGTVSSPDFTDNSGVAYAVFSDLGIIGSDAAVATITARVDHPFWGTRSNTVQVTVQENENELPKVPSFINMVANFTELPPVDFPDTTFSRLSLYVSDSTGFPVDAGTEVTFSTDIGFVTPFTLTDEEGNASAIFTMGDSSGIAKVYAYSGAAIDSVLIQIRPMEAAYIIIPPVSPNFIVVQGGWGAESTTLFAEVRDARGELVDTIYDVDFTIGPAPAGSNLNGEGSTVTVETNYGVASVTLNSGTESGPVQLTVSTTLPDGGGTITSVGMPVIVRAGLPAHINADIDINAITPVGGGFYELEAAALVWDEYTNPVEDSTQIYWSLIPDTLGDIIGESYTNNENLNGDNYPGMAWTRIYYNSGVIFDTLQIVARTWGADGDTVTTFVNADADSMQILPFYPGTLSVTPSASFHDFGTDPTNPWPTVLTASLTDYYNNPIFGGRILFSAIGFDHFEDMDGNVIDPPIAVTNEQGTAQVVVFFDQSLCTPNFNAEDEVISYDPFTAYVWGTLIDPQITASEQMSIELRRSIPE